MIYGRSLFLLLLFWSESDFIFNKDINFYYSQAIEKLFDLGRLSQFGIMKNPIRLLENYIIDHKAHKLKTKN